MEIRFCVSILNKVIFSSFCFSFISIASFEDVKSFRIELLNSSNLSKLHFNPSSKSFFIASEALNELIILLVIMLLNLLSLLIFSSTPYSTFRDRDSSNKLFLLEKSRIILAILFRTSEPSKVIFSSFCLSFTSISSIEEVNPPVKELKSSRIKILNSSNLSKPSASPISRSFFIATDALDELVMLSVTKPSNSLNLLILFSELYLTFWSRELNSSRMEPLSPSNLSKLPSNLISRSCFRPSNALDDVIILSVKIPSN